MIARIPIATLSIVLLCLAQSPVQLTHEQKLGKAIFLSGESPSGGRITARIDAGTTPVSGAILACGGCHGADGLGRSEGGVMPPGITWEALTLQKRPAYNEQTLKRAITLGIDPAGKPVGAVMPRYQMSYADMNSLLAYLHVLGREIDPGVGESEVRIGVLLPPGDRLSEMRDAIRVSLESFAADANQKGGVFGRRISLRFHESESNGDDRVAGIDAFLRRENVFALVASFLNGAEKQIAAMVNERHVPLIGALSLYTRTSREPNRFVFYLLAGLAEQGECLALAMSRIRKSPPKSAILLAGDELAEFSADAIEAQYTHLGWQPPIRIRQSPRTAVVAELRERPPDVVFVMAPGILKDLIAGDSLLRSKPLYLVPGSLADVEPTDIPSQVRDRVLLSFPALPSDNTPAGMQLFRRLVVASPANSRHVAAQWAALSSASLLLTALNSSGRQLTQERMLAALETLYRFDTGLLPPATFGPNRRVASAGAHVMSAADPARSVWIEPH